MNYDPIFEAGEQTIPVPTPLWNASWVWYPGQLGAHLHTAIFQKAIRRCMHIGYPGNYCQPEFHAEYRFSANLAQEVEARWAAPPSRTRVRINGREVGDITLRQCRIPKGPVEITVSVDLAASLPCILFNAPGLSTGPGWEVSLDGSTWSPVEFQHPACSPTRLPDLDMDVHLPLRPKRVVSLQGGIETKDVYHLEPGGELVVDFWHDELGDLQVEAAGAGELHLFVGESLLEVMEDAPAVGEQYPLSSLPLSDNPQTFRLPERCLRFLRFKAGAACEIRQVIFNARIYPVTYRGWFETGDERLDNIWKAGAATLHSNIHDAAILDGLKRDAMVWLFDENIDFEGSDLVFFDRQIVQNTLVSKSPPPVVGLKDIGMPDMRLYYIMGFYHDYLVSGDPSFACRYRKSITDLLELLVALQNERGFIMGRSFSPLEAMHGAGSSAGESTDWLSEFFPDWAGKSDRPGEVRPIDIDGPGTPAYAQMMVMRVFEIGAIFASLWQDEALSLRYRANAARLRAAIRETFWDEERGAFINGLTRNGQRDERLSMYAQAWGILTGLVLQPDLKRVVETLVNLHPRPNNLSMSTYWEYLAYIKAGRYDLALERLRRYWGQMLDQGLSRFIEDIRPGDNEKDRLVFYGNPYGLSLAHGWSGATAVSILMRGAIGLEILLPGYRQVELTPNWRIFKHLKLTIPTPLGNLSVHYDQGASEVLEVPDGMQVRLREGDRVSEFTGPGRVDLHTLR